MSSDKHNKKLYDAFGEEYHNSSRHYNKFIEIPNMVRAVGDIKDKKLLDIGCGAGEHIMRYVKKGARCHGIDISETMIREAKTACPNVEFKVASMKKNTLQEIII